MFTRAHWVRALKLAACARQPAQPTILKRRCERSVVDVFRFFCRIFAACPQMKMFWHRLSLIVTLSRTASGPSRFGVRRFDAALVFTFRRGHRRCQEKEKQERRQSAALQSAKNPLLASGLPDRIARPDRHLRRPFRLAEQEKCQLGTADDKLIKNL
jgi:hypothetical protein